MRMCNTNPSDYIFPDNDRLVNKMHDSSAILVLFDHDLVNSFVAYYACTCKWEI